MLYNENLDVISLNPIPLNIYEKVCNSCTRYIILFALFFITNICTSSVLIYFHWYLNKIMFGLSLILVLKKQFIKHINGKYQTN